MNPIQSKSLPALAAALAAAVLTTIPARGAPWTPADLPQPPALWLDASDSGTITLSGSAVSQWNDKSGNSRDFAQATGGNQPAYSATSFNTSYPGVTFDGSSDFMSAGDTLDMRTNSLTVMSAVRYATSNNSGVIIAKTRYAGGAGRWVLYRALTGSALGSGTQYNTVLQPDLLPGAILQVANSSTSAKINGFVLDRSTSGACKIWDNGTNTASATFTGNTTDFNNSDQLWLGAYQNPSGTTPPTAGSYLNGVISEVVVVQTAMSDTDRQKLEGYLAWKWGMQANLPADHPYKSAAPESSDTTPPAIVTLNPADDATGVLTYANLAATFNDAIQKGTGNITLKKSADNSTVETFDVATSPRITVSGSVLTIDPTGYLEGTTGYYVEIDATAVKDLANNAFAGIADTTTWNFTTGVADTTAPTIATLSPADDATGEDLVANLVATFDENIQKGTGFITLKKSADNSEVETFDVATSPQVTVSGATLTINPTANLAFATGYYVQIDPTAIQDLSGNSFAGIADSTTWNFTTRAIVLYDDFAVNPNLSSGLWTHSRPYGNYCGTPAWNSETLDLTLGLPTTVNSWSLLRRTDATRGATDLVTLQIKSLSKSGTDWGVVGLNISAVATPNVGSTSPRYQFFLITDNGTDWFYALRRDANTTVWTSSPFTLASLVFPIRLDAVRNGDNYDFKVNGSTVVTGSSYTSAQHDSLVYYHMTWSIGYYSAMTATVDNFGIPAHTSPLDDATNVLTSANLVATFGEPVQAGSGFITIKKTSDDTTVEAFDVASSLRVTFTGRSVTIDPTSDLGAGTEYYVQIDATAVKDMAGNPFAGIADTTSWSFTTDGTPPTVSTLSPLDDATNALASANLVATFGEPVQAGSGFITIKKTSDDTAVEAFDVASSAQLTFGGPSVTINPTSDLAVGTGYYVQIDSTAVKDMSGNPFAGIADTTSWSFTTDGTPPTVATLSPADDATGEAPNANLVATFDENIQKGTGFITLKKSADNSEVETFDVATSPRITVSGASLTIDPTANLAFATGYYVQIDPTAIQDLSGNSFAGIADSTTWNFTTRALVLYDDFAVNPNLSSGSWTHSVFITTFCGTPAWNSGTEDLTLGLSATASTWSLLRRTDATRGATDPVTLQIKSLSNSGTSWGLVGLNISAVATPILGSTSPRYQFFLITDNGTDWKYQLRRDNNTTLWTSSPFTLASLVFPIRLDAVRNGDNYDFKVNGSTVVTGSFYTSAQHDSLVYYHMTWSIGTPSAMTATVDNFGISAATPTTGYAAWQTANGTTGTIDQDHDADGVPNGIEYFLGGNTDTTGFTALPPVSNNSGVLSVTWTKAADYAGNYGPAADFVVQTSDTLTSWSPASTSGTPNTPDTVYLNGNDVTYTFPSPLDAKKFARLVVTGP